MNGRSTSLHAIFRLIICILICSFMASAAHGEKKKALPKKQKAAATSWRATPGQPAPQTASRPSPASSVPTADVRQALAAMRANNLLEQARQANTASETTKAWAFWLQARHLVPSLRRPEWLVQPAGGLGAATGTAVSRPIATSQTRQSPETPVWKYLVLFLLFVLLLREIRTLVTAK